MKKILGGLAAACLAGVVAAGAAAAPPTLPATITMVAVSYTHLTLPTICSV